MPNNCVFLVDTYDTLEGVRRAVEVGRRLRRARHEMVGIRLDSGDLARLSIEARRLLDEGGFPDAAIIASSDLDEHLIERLKQQGATIGVWGVGTRLATAYDQPALGGVYKLSAVRDGDGPWQDKLKLSEQPEKTSTPGILQVRRFRSAGRPIGDVIFDVRRRIAGDCVLVDLADPGRRQTFPAGTPGEDLLVPVLREGKRVYDAPPVEEARRLAQQQLDAFSAGVKRLENPESYPVGLEEGLDRHKRELIEKAKESNR
jgi:nicotinate phosphoribosyltransferase